MFNKSTESAIAAMSYLAEKWDGGRTTVKAADIARDRHLQLPFVAKLLTQLSLARLIRGSPGRGGGYVLARPPEEIPLIEIVQRFERKDPTVLCPFGQQYCGKVTPCPIHEDILRLQAGMEAFLGRTTLAVFAQKRGEEAE